MTSLRRVLIPFAVVATAVGAVATVAQTSSASPARPAAATSYSATIAGTDTHPIDPHMHSMFVDGGGVTPIFVNADGPPHFTHLEAGIDLPVGAKVMSVQATVTGCSSFNAAQVVFGSYQPTTSNTLQSATL